MAQPTSRLFVALYTDEDVTTDLAPALRRRGYAVQSTRQANNAELSDEAQLAYATEQGMAILTGLFESDPYFHWRDAWLNMFGF